MDAGARLSVFTRAVVGPAAGKRNKEQGQSRERPR